MCLVHVTVCAFALSFGAPQAALGDPPIIAPGGPADVPVANAFRAAPGFIGPIQYATSLALVANDIVSLDPYAGNGSGTGGAVLNYSTHASGNGAQTVLASSSVGSGAGTGYGNNAVYGTNIAVSPAGLIYYFALRSVNGTPYIDLVELTPSTLARRVVSVGDNASLGPVLNGAKDFCWDLSTNTVLCFYINTSNVVALVRINPSTGVRTPVTLFGGPTLNSPSYMTTDAFGNLFYLEITGSGFANNVVVVPTAVAGAGVFNAGRVVNTSSSYYELDALAVDPSQPQTISGGLPTAQSLIFADEGVDQTSSAIYRVSSAVGGARSTIINNASNTASGTAVFDLPDAVAVDTTGKIYYAEFHNFANGNSGNVNTLNYLSFAPPKNNVLSGAQNLGPAGVDSFRDLIAVPPPQPAQTASTSNVLGSTATLNGNITADGGVTNSGIITRGFVYAPTSTTSTPRIGGTGVTQLSNFTASTIPVAQNANLGTYTANITGLTAGTSYTVSTYAQNVSGFGYSTPLTFVTATSPTVTTTTPATGITGTGATLGGNVTGTGGGNATITARGVVYSSTNNTPTIGGTGVTNLADASATTGSFTKTATGLAQGTTYYFRAYATNQVGTAYGSIGSFATFSAPTANNQSVNVAFNTATPITLTGSDPNNPAQTLTYNVTGQPAHGTLSGTPPNLTYTPTVGYNGTDSFTFTTTNSSGLTSNTATVTLNVARGTPTANSQSVSVQFNTATSITLTGSDPDVPALTLTYTVVSTPTRGTLSGTAPNLTYTPNANTQGADSFTFRVSNGTNTSNTATVSITVAAGTPTANSQSVSTTFNTAKSITLTGTDPDSPALALTYAVTTTPSHGTLSGTAPNLTYTPTANYQGADSFTFTVSNGQRTSGAATVSITVSPGTPTANSQSVNVNLNRPQTITLTGTDPDSPALALTYTVVTAPANGTLSGTAPNLTYTPNTNYTGSDSFTFRVSNGTNTSNTATVSLTVVGQPIISSFTPASGPVGTLVTINGTNLQNATGLNFFRNVAGTNFTVVSSTQVTVRVPAGASTGILTVLSGSGSNSSSTKFTVTP